MNAPGLVRTTGPLRLHQFLNVEFAVNIPAALHPNVKPSEHEALSRLLTIAFSA